MVNMQRALNGFNKKVEKSGGCGKFEEEGVVSLYKKVSVPILLLLFPPPML